MIAANHFFPTIEDYQKYLQRHKMTLERRGEAWVFAQVSEKNGKLPACPHFL